MNDRCPVHEAEEEYDRRSNRAEVDRDPDDYEREYVTMEEIHYNGIVYNNTIAGLKAGAELTSRSGIKYKLSDHVTSSMTAKDIDLQARILASYIVG